MNPSLILVPLDRSPLSEAALPYAEALAAAERRRLRLFSVVETVIDGLFQEKVRLNGGLDTVRTEIARKSLDRLAEGLRARGLEVEAETTLGAPAPEILGAGAHDDVAMIVMATHGRGGADRWVIGSVADKVMRSTSKPLLLVRPGGRSSPSGEAGLRRLLVPLDGSPLAQAALEPATELAFATRAKLVLLHVVPFLTATMDWGTGFVPELTEIEAEMAASAQQSLEELRAGLPAGLQSEAVVLRGPVAITIEDYIQQHQIDLTIMTTHGRGGFTRFVLGSTADRLVRSGASVLLIHGEGEEASEPKEAGSQHPAGTSGGG
ncbi:MAG TPA: universal stress protein [Dehalococcoidia bacterium]|nr:universal stress protein [Dehalococcoidia bacterium]